MIGQKIQNYKIISLLGEGGMANVYLAENQLLGSKVAFKLLKEEYVQHPNIRKRFLAEARNLAQMSHPNIIKVTDLIDAGDIVAFVMEYIEGDTLEHYIEHNGKLPNEEIESFLKQMIEAVIYVHSQGLIHRDIKPSNFMLTKGGAIKLLDFGIAKNTNDDAADYTKTGLMQQMGTPMYMSPEQVKNTSEVTKETDIYSLGVVLWQMVTGKKPYNSDTLSLPEIQVAILKEPLPLTNSVWDEKIKIFCNKNLESRPKDFKNIIIPIKYGNSVSNINDSHNDEISLQTEEKIRWMKNKFVSILTHLSVFKKLKLKHIFILSLLISSFTVIYYYLAVYQIPNPNELPNSLKSEGLFGKVKSVKEVYISDPNEVSRYSKRPRYDVITKEKTCFDKKGNVVSEIETGFFKYSNTKMSGRNIHYKNFYNDKNQLIKVSHIEKLNEKWTKYSYQNGYLIFEEANSPNSKVEYKYDKRGNKIERKFNNGFRKFNYNDKNLCISTIFFYEGKLDSKEFNTYTKDNLVQSIEYEYSGKKITSKTIKKYNNFEDEIYLRTIYSSGEKPRTEEHEYEYDKMGNWIKKTYYTINEFNIKIVESVANREIEYY
jgi:serine/threonine protein kinase